MSDTIKTNNAILILILGALSTVASASVRVEAGCVFVIYPEVRAPYSDVFEGIIGGIEKGVDEKVRRVMIPATENPTPHADPMNIECDSVIALGKGGYEYIKPLIGRRRVVVGAVVMLPGESIGVPVLSFTPEPREIFKRLRYLSTNIKRVNVILGPGSNAEYIEIAARDAKEFGIELREIKAQSSPDVLQSYRQVLESVDPRTDSLWLLEDSSGASVKEILPFILEKAWDRKITVFSNQSAYVKYGVLFATYPNNALVGRRLASMIADCKDDCAEAAVVLSEDVSTAVNVRTAARLNIHVDKDSPYLDMVYPKTD